MGPLQDAYEADANAHAARWWACALATATFAIVGLYCLALARNDPPEKVVIPKVSAVVLMAPLALNLAAFIAGEDSGKYARRLAVGLILCAAGDACLELEGSPSFASVKELLFLGGLGAFLAGHLVYIAAFAVNRFKIRTVVATPVLTYVLVVYIILYPNLPRALLAPVFVYASAIGWMMVMACSRLPAGTAHSAWSARTASAGGVIFALSDTVLAINRFVVTLPAAKGFVMTTYFLAQALITASAVGAGSRKTKPGDANSKTD